MFEVLTEDENFKDCKLKLGENGVQYTGFKYYKSIIKYTYLYIFRLLRLRLQTLIKVCIM